MLTKWELTIPALSGDVPRRAYVYVPAAWEEDPSLRFPVLYMFDGHNLFFDQDATYGKSWGLLEYLEANRTPLIVAAVECNHGPNSARLVEYCPFACEMPNVGYLPGKGKQYMEWLCWVFKPEIDRRFPTIRSRASTFIAGSSIGGLMSLYAVMAYNCVFSRAAALSPSIWFGAGKMDRLIRTAPISPGTVVYMDYGSRELDFHINTPERYRRVSTLLLERGVHLTTRIVPGGNHNEASWERQIPFFLPALLYEA